MQLRKGLYGHRKRVCFESWLWEKNPLLHQEIEPASAGASQMLYQLSYIPNHGLLSGIHCIHLWFGGWRGEDGGGGGGGTEGKYLHILFLQVSPVISF